MRRRRAVQMNLRVSSCRQKAYIYYTLEKRKALSPRLVFGPLIRTFSIQRKFLRFIFVSYSLHLGNTIRQSRSPDGAAAAPCGSPRKSFTASCSCIICGSVCMPPLALASRAIAAVASALPGEGKRAPSRRSAPTKLVSSLHTPLRTVRLLTRTAPGAMHMQSVLRADRERKTSTS